MDYIEKKYIYISHTIKYIICIAYIYILYASSEKEKRWNWLYPVNDDVVPSVNGRSCDVNCVKVDKRHQILLYILELESMKIAHSI